jgi:hypothetical protein
MAERFIESRAQAFKGEFLSFLWKSSRRTRPGWLTRHGYLIALIDEAAFKSSIYAAVPKKRGKHRVDTKRMKQLLANFDPSAITLLKPSVLNTLEMQNYQGTFFAVGPRGKRRLIPLRYIPLKTRMPAWVGLDGMAKELPLLMDVLLPAELREQVKIIWYKIYDALRLDEVGLERD